MATGCLLYTSASLFGHSRPLAGIHLSPANKLQDGEEGHDIGYDADCPHTHHAQRQSAAERLQNTPDHPLQVASDDRACLVALIWCAHGDPASQPGPREEDEAERRYHGRRIRAKTNVGCDCLAYENRRLSVPFYRSGTGWLWATQL